MKTVKIILIIVSAIFFVFFATGVVVKDINYKAEVSIEKPIEEVFNTFVKIDSVKNWIPEIKSVKVINKNPGITGSVYSLVVLNEEQEINFTEKILAYVPTEKVTLFYNADSMTRKYDYTFSEENGVTTISLDASSQSKSYIMACVFPYFASNFEKQEQVYLNNFKAYLENK